MSLILKIGLVEAKKKCNWCKQPEKKKKVQKRFKKIPSDSPWPSKYQENKNHKFSFLTHSKSPRILQKHPHILKKKKNLNTVFKSCSLYKIFSSHSMKLYFLFLIK